MSWPAASLPLTKLTTGGNYFCPDVVSYQHSTTSTTIYRAVNNCTYIVVKDRTILCMHDNAHKLLLFMCCYLLTNSKASCHSFKTSIGPWRKRTRWMDKTNPIICDDIIMMQDRKEGKLSKLQKNHFWVN